MKSPHTLQIDYYDKGRFVTRETHWQNIYLHVFKLWWEILVWIHDHRSLSFDILNLRYSQAAFTGDMLILKGSML